MKTSAVTAPMSATDHRRAIAKRIEQLGYRHSPWNAFSDFLELSAISISNAVDLVQREARETRYLEIVKRYDAEELAAFPEMLGDLVLALEAGFDDVLGRLFHDLELHNKYAGQFFSPYAIAQLMASMSVDREQVERAIAARGFITANEPACGAGGMMIALTDALKRLDINYQQHLHVTAVDVDLKCVHMAYLQLSLLGIPAVVVHGNTLTLEEHSHWYTPAHILGGWSWKLRRAERAAVAPTEKPAPIAEPAVLAPLAAVAVEPDEQFALDLLQPEAAA